MANTFADIAHTLQQARQDQRLSYRELGERAGVTELSARSVLLGRSAPKLTTLIALADVLGLELVLLPRLVAEGVAPHRAQEPAPLSAVEQLVQDLRGRQS